MIWNFILWLLLPTLAQCLQSQHMHALHMDDDMMVSAFSLVRHAPERTIRSMPVPLIRTETSSHTPLLQDIVVEEPLGPWVEDAWEVHPLPPSGQPEYEGYAGEDEWSSTDYGSGPGSEEEEEEDEF